jgi:Lon protease-like protein
MAAIPMFPLGTVLLPTMVMPLHIFEPRYRQLVRHCLDTSNEFGVCLIERGSEVGGGDIRTDVGTLAQIVDAQQFPDGRWAIATVGTRRFRIQSWLDDDPYPRADVEYWNDDSALDLSVERDNMVDLLQSVRLLQAAIDGTDPAPVSTLGIGVDPTLASYQTAAMSPLGPFDRQQLLATPDTKERLDLLTALLGALESDLRAQSL